MGNVQAIFQIGHSYQSQQLESKSKDPNKMDLIASKVPHKLENENKRIKESDTYVCSQESTCVEFSDEEIDLKEPIENKSITIKPKEINAHIKETQTCLRISNTPLKSRSHNLQSSKSESDTQGRNKTLNNSSSDEQDRDEKPTKCRSQKDEKRKSDNHNRSSEDYKDLKDLKESKHKFQEIGDRAL
ncbi:hypothetical protein F8M41_011965 [Gigaspora margarita]|uniref:Uncharacterized protein n=1 Tax=Gigaspora margarita TaxID=4874 RepID=A0A8H4A278_GIGMA|nr:hypothetical protein F8M41_011965 [Gigaspora margarita]